MNFRRNRSQEEPEINLIPLIDVVLVIIIFLTLTTTFNKISGMEVALPTAEAADTPEVSTEINVAISSTNEVMVADKMIVDQSVGSIADALSHAVPAGEQLPVVVINADAKAAHQSVVNVMQAAQQAGLAHITFATRQVQN
ncbi:MAG: biopolymer transporter ExbD [Azoarcus sp.]|jgi:biopolymer transport protein ExbD|nr:biopolymer transporter ExbD [Azoarcus sp.]